MSAVSSIRLVSRRDETILRLGGDGGNYAMTWTIADTQLVTVFDGAGWPEFPQEYFCTRVFAASGSPESAAFAAVQGYPNLSLWDMIAGHAAPFYGTSALAVGSCIYQFLATSDHPFLFADRSTWADFCFNGAKLIYSPDNGRSWFNQDGSTPVTREARSQLSRKTMTFLREPNGAFSLLSFLQMGRGYEDNTDGYVYVYSVNGATRELMSELIMFRVPKEALRDRNRYEYFAGRQSDGGATWTRDIDRRGIVHRFPHGWDVSPMMPMAWLPSVVYNRALGTYMMASCASGSESGGNAIDIEAASRPTYLGLWVAPNPWGPWRQIHEETVWAPAGDLAARPYSAQIAPKWISADGKSFWLTWWDGQSMRGFKAAFNEERMLAVEAGLKDRYRALRFKWRQFHPYFALNAQRFDLVLA